MQPPNNNPRQIKVELPANPGAIYSNTVMISHTQHEVIFDFIQVLPNDPRARIQQRVVMTPAHAKMFLNALQENLGRFETRFGEITLPPRPGSLADQLFSNIHSGGDSGGDDSHE